MQHSKGLSDNHMPSSGMEERSSWIRRGILRGLTLSPISNLWAPFRGDRALVLMFHRFAPEADGHSQALFRRTLQYLRSRRYVVMDLERIVRAGLTGDPVPRKAVAITFDDAYHDHFDVALPLLAEFDMPATFFLSSGFSDGVTWMWWDQIAYLATRGNRRQLDLTVGGERFQADLSAPSGSLIMNRMIERCKRVPDSERHAAIHRMAVAVECELPAVPPAEYRPLTWDQARIAERFGIRFGPGSVSHSILSRLDDATAAYEIEHSWNRLKEELSSPSPIFCYPNGKTPDFGPREVRLCAQAGLLGAVSAEHAYLNPRALSKTPSSAFAIPRFSAPESFVEVVRLLSGLQVLLGAVLGEPSHS